MPSYGQHSDLLYPLKRPCFITISDPIFAGNSQNFLKKPFFRRFTCMFTVCSYLRILLEPYNDCIAQLNYSIFLTNATIQILQCVSNLSRFHEQNNFVKCYRLPFRREALTSPLISLCYLFLVNFHFHILYFFLSSVSIKLHR